MAFFNAMQSKSDLSIQNAGLVTSQPFTKKHNNFQSNTNIVNPKTVKEWVMKNSELNRTLTDGNITSSLMKKANNSNTLHVPSNDDTRDMSATIQAS